MRVVVQIYLSFAIMFYKHVIDTKLEHELFHLHPQDGNLNLTNKKCKLTGIVNCSHYFVLFKRKKNKDFLVTFSHQFVHLKRPFLLGWNVLILISLFSLRLMWLFRCCCSHLIIKKTTQSFNFIGPWPPPQKEIVFPC